MSKGEGQKKLTVFVHPILEAYLLRGEPIKMFKGWFGSSIRMEWEKELNISLEVESNSSMEILEFNIYNVRGEELTI
ncbi:MAG: hypothetical protein ACKVJ6_02085 [Flavobacteriales bacterium]